MTPETQSELLSVVADLCERYPHWRMGQLISNIAGWADVNIWDVEDEQLLEAAKAHLEHLRERERIQT